VNKVSGFVGIATKFSCSAEKGYEWLEIYHNNGRRTLRAQEARGKKRDQNNKKPAKRRRKEEHHNRSVPLPVISSGPRLGGEEIRRRPVVLVLSGSEDEIGPDGPDDYGDWSDDEIGTDGPAPKESRHHKGDRAPMVKAEGDRTLTGSSGHKRGRKGSSHQKRSRDYKHVRKGSSHRKSVVAVRRVRAPTANPSSSARKLQKLCRDVCKDRCSY
jgi:hypothetical protein